MSATNSTTHYNLPSFLGSDKPAWLVDWNGAMASIDSAIYEAKTTADSAVTAAAAVASDLATLSGTVSTQGSSITTLSETLTTAVGNINTINGNITTINSLIGNGTPTTTDQTIIGAINEINDHVNSSDISDDVTVNASYLYAKDAKRSGDVVTITIQVTNVDTTSPVTVGSVANYLKPDIVKIASTIYGNYPVFGLLKEDGTIEIRSEVQGTVGGALTFTYVI